MCLIAVAVDPNPLVAYVIAANRDELYERPTRAAHRWEDAPRVVGGRDLRAGGSWLGLSDDGRFAAITNVRDPGARGNGASRGELVRRFLVGHEAPTELCAWLAAEAGRFPAFNLVVGDARGAFYTNELGVVTPLGPGVHALSNARLDVPWPKVIRLREAMIAATRGATVDEEALFAALADRRPAADDELPSTGVPLEWERMLSSPFILGAAYGTRSSTVVVIRRDGAPASFEERTFGPDGVALDRARLSV